MKRVLLIPGFLLAIASLTSAPTARAAGETIHIVDANARPTPPGVTAGVVYLMLMNHGAEDDTLTGISTPIADMAELHRSVTENGIARMPPVTGFVIKSNDGVTFKPGGLHIMLMGLKQPLKIGQTFPVTLTFAKAGPVEITVTVQPLKPPKPSMDGMKM